MLEAAVCEKLGALTKNKSPIVEASVGYSLRGGSYPQLKQGLEFCSAEEGWFFHNAIQYASPSLLPF